MKKGDTVKCPHCGEELKLFAGDNTVFEKEGVELLGRLPFDPQFMRVMLERKISGAKEEIFTDIYKKIADKLKG